MSKYVFTPAHYMKQKLEEEQGNKNISEKLLTPIKIELDKRHIQIIDRNIIKSILRDLNLQKYYSLVPSIVKQLNKDKCLNKTILDDEIECPICFEEIKEAIKLECTHLFCETCMIKINSNNSIKCPLCRQVQETVKEYNLSDDDMKIILTEFINTEKEYRIVKNYISFSEIIKDIAHRKGIKLHNNA